MRHRVNVYRAVALIIASAAILLVFGFADHFDAESWQQAVLRIVGVLGCFAVAGLLLQWRLGTTNAKGAETSGVDIFIDGGSDSDGGHGHHH
jgi:hypothetical protein